MKNRPWVEPSPCHGPAGQVMEELLHNGAKVGARSALREDTSGMPGGGGKRKGPWAVSSSPWG